MASSKIKVDKELYKKACELAEASGYTSVDEFVSHIIEQEVAKEDEVYSEEEAEKIKDRLQGLGYIS